MASLLAFMTLLTFAQVFMRYLFNSGWVWSLEATTYCFAALVLIGMSYGVRTGTHITVELAVSKMSPRVKPYIKGLAIVVCIVYAALMLYGATVFIHQLETLNNMARDIPLPKWLLTTTIPLGFALLCFRFLEAGWKLVTGRDDTQISEDKS